MIASPLAALALVAIVFSTLAWFSRICSQTSVDQPELYWRLGGHPLYPTQRVIATQFRWLRFIFGGRYRNEVESPELRRSIGRFLIWYLMTNVPLIVVLLVSIFLALTGAYRAV